MKINKIYFDTIPSTNLYAKNNIININDGDIIIARNQTNGYGRFNRNWHTHKNDSIAISICLIKEMDYNLIGKFSIVSAVSIVNVLEKYVDNLVIKWPNDLLINNKKIGGILIETVIKENKLAVIIGIGLNINNRKFPRNIYKKATSLYLETGKIINIDYLIDEIILEMIKNIENTNASYNKFFDKYKNKSIVLNKEIIYNNRKYKVKNINNDGSLQVIDNENKIINIESGEITLESLY